MKTEYTNKTNSLKQVLFEDNTSVFLKRGQSTVSDKEVKLMGKGITTKEVRPTKRRSSSSENSTEE